MLYVYLWQNHTKGTDNGIYTHARQIHKQTLAFEKLWHWTQRASIVYRSGEQGGDIHTSLLDIYPEGQLEREIKDIIEEVGIMMHINKTHRDILKSFIKHAKHILDPTGQYCSDAGHRHSGLKSPEQSTPNTEKTTEATSHNENQRLAYEWFSNNADELYENVGDRIEELEELEKSAKATAESVSITYVVGLTNDGTEQLYRLRISWISNSNKPAWSRRGMRCGSPRKASSKREA